MERLVVVVVAAMQVACGGKTDPEGAPSTEDDASVPPGSLDADTTTCEPSPGISLLGPAPDAALVAVGRTAMDSTHVYWLLGSPTSQTLFSVRKCGGPARALVSGIAGDYPLDGGGFLATGLALAADETSVYWTVPTSEVGASWDIWRAQSDGATSLVVDAGMDSIALLALDVDATNLYWSATKLVDGSPAGNAVMSMPKAGGAPTVLAQDTTGESFTMTITHNDTQVVWVASSPQGVSDIRAVAKSGGPVTTVASAVQYSVFVPQGLAVDATHAYWSETASDQTHGSVVAAPLTGGPAVQLASVGVYPGSPSQVDVHGVAVDDTSVYWAESPNGSPGGIRKVAKGGGVPVTLAPVESGPSSILVDGTNVYWLDDVGNVSTVAK
jgi:hypothetical protein